MIEARYHIRIDFLYPTTGDGDLEHEALDKALFDLPLRNVVELCILAGGSVYDSYLTCWSDLAEDAEYAEAQIVNLLLEHGCTITKGT